MRIIDTVPSSTDKDVKTAVIKVGMDELKLILAVINTAYKGTPRVNGTIPTLGRLRNMRKVIQDYLTPMQEVFKDRISPTSVIEEAL